jgi:2,3-bisphosphoglycerate-dependent phosphoglycerate mutase
MLTGPFFYLRHGITQANIDGLMCGGAWDIALAERGVQQAMEVAERLGTLAPPRPQVIYSSPMLRALQTAEILEGKLKLSMEVVEDLREWDMGEWDRKPFLAVKDQFLGGGEPKGGETREALRVRTAKTLKAILKPDELPLLVSHGGIGMMIQLILELSPFRLENCVPYRFSPDLSGKARIEPLFG